MNATQVSPIDRLATLSTQRTARTDRLHESVCALLAQLEDHTEVGAAVTIDGYTLRLTRVRSNVGYTDFWTLESGDGCVHLERPVDSEGYLHGDFHAALHGPAREDLIAFGTRAGRFVSAMIAREEKALADLSTAHAAVTAAAEEIR